MDLAFDVTHLISFLVGTSTGAAGGYFTAKYTDRRRKKEAIVDLDDHFNKVAALMPQLIAQMKLDFTNEENLTIREFVILPNRRVMFQQSHPRFVYFENEHENLIGKIKVLENHGFVIDVTPSNTPIYRIDENFWRLVFEC